MKRFHFFLQIVDSRTFSLKPFKLSMESCSFFLNQLTTDVLVRSEEATTHFAVVTDDNDDDDGPFFDLEFAVPDED